MLRSLVMERVQLLVPKECALDTMDQLGKIERLHFIDLNQNTSSFRRTFVKEIERCIEMEKKMNYIKETIDKEETINKDFIYGQYDRPIEEDDFDSLEIKLNQHEKEIREINANLEMLYKKELQNNEMLAIYNEENDNDNDGINNYNALNSSSDSSDDDDEEYIRLNSLNEKQKDTVLDTITGVILTQDFHVFERILWRRLRGNFFIKSRDIKNKLIDPVTKLSVEKTAFTINFQGEHSRNIIEQICTAMHVNVYRSFRSQVEKERFVNKLFINNDDIHNAIEKSHEAIIQFLYSFSIGTSECDFIIQKRKIIYSILNLCKYDESNKCIIAEAWCPKKSIAEVIDTLNVAQHRSGSITPSILTILQTDEIPPTFFETTEFTEQFQSLINAYGVPSYGEINPTCFTIITFPLLFGIMFGDWGHGLILLLFSSLLIYYQKKIKSIYFKLNDIFTLLFDGRYLILFMSFFAIYCGLLYNDFFSLPFNLFGSKYSLDSNNQYQKIDDSVYPFGIDPAWKNSSNTLIYSNSMKMKLSIIIGFIQMLFGIVLSYHNFKYFNQKADIILTFIPQIVLFVSVFGYLIFLILIKWLFPLKNTQSLITVFINMFLNFGKLKEEDHLFPLQNNIQTLIVVVAALCVLILLVGKPLYIYFIRKRNRKYVELVEEDGYELNDDNIQENSVDYEKIDFFEVTITNSIHNIEFILGCVSNLASYLRLWALSLAHSELSLVFYEQVLLRAIRTKSFIIIAFGFIIWLLATIGILCMMESLSAFLHALRLHWVEFQNKFYTGEGTSFKPFSTRKETILQ